MCDTAVTYANCQRVKTWRCCVLLFLANVHQNHILRTDTWGHMGPCASQYRDISGAAPGDKRWTTSLGPKHGSTTARTLLTPNNMAAGAVGHPATPKQNNVTPCASCCAAGWLAHFLRPKEWQRHRALRCNALPRWLVVLAAQCLARVVGPRLFRCNAEPRVSRNCNDKNKRTRNGEEGAGSDRVPTPAATKRKQFLPAKASIHKGPCSSCTAARPGAAAASGAETAPKNSIRWTAGGLRVCVKGACQGYALSCTRRLNSSARRNLKKLKLFEFKPVGLGIRRAQELGHPGRRARPATPDAG